MPKGMVWDIRCPCQPVAVLCRGIADSRVSGDGRSLDKCETGEARREPLPVHGQGCPSRLAQLALLSRVWQGTSYDSSSR